MTKSESEKSKKLTLPRDKAGASAPPEEPEFAFFMPADQEAGDGQESVPSPVTTVGNIIFFCGVFSTIITLIWKFIPDTILPFAKTSLIGFSVITLARLFLSLLLPVAFFVFRYRIDDTKILGRNPGIGAVILSFLIGCPSALIFVSIHNLLVRFFIAAAIPLTLPAFFYASEDISTESRLLALAAAFIIPVLLQELFFRGLLFSVWPQSSAVFPKILLSGLLFTVFLQNPVDFIPLFLLGILLAYVRHATDHFLCPVITQISMLVTYWLFSSLLPYKDYITASVTGDLDSTSLYTAIAALVMSLLAFLPVLSQLRRMSHDAAKIARPQDETAAESLHGQFGWSFGLGLILFATSWVLLLGI
ncbi:MAG: type II CAAX endopeptidase family protein [Eubacteriales bacterium]